jgi:hypothetical protein
MHIDFLSSSGLMRPLQDERGSMDEDLIPNEAAILHRSQPWGCLIFVSKFWRFVSFSSARGSIYQR